MVNFNIHIIRHSVFPLSQKVDGIREWNLQKFDFKTYLCFIIFLIFLFLFIYLYIAFTVIWETGIAETYII